MDRKRIPVCNRKVVVKELLYLENYDYTLILDIYAQRYLLSHLFRDCKGYACDIDHIGFLNGGISNHRIEVKRSHVVRKPRVRNGKIMIHQSGILMGLEAFCSLHGIILQH